MGSGLWISLRGKEFWRHQEGGEDWGARNRCLKSNSLEFESWLWYCDLGGMVFFNLSKPIHIENENKTNLWEYVNRLATWTIKRKKKKAENEDPRKHFFLPPLYQFSKLISVDHHIVFFRKRYLRLPGLHSSALLYIAVTGECVKLLSFTSRNSGALMWDLSRRVSSHIWRHRLQNNSKSYKVLKSPQLKHLTFVEVRWETHSFGFWTVGILERWVIPCAFWVLWKAPRQRFVKVHLPFCGKSVSLLCDPLEPFTTFHGHHLKMQAGTGRPGISVDVGLKLNK